MKKFYAQQGDVILKKIDTLPAGAKKLDTKILQHGEVTNHKHQFAGNQAVEIYVSPDFAGLDNSITPDEGKFVVVGDTAYLSHEEHRTIALEPGVYQIDIVREFSYDDMESKRVID